MTTNIQKNNRGASLLLTLLILTAVLAIAFGVANLMWRELKLTQDVSKSLKAYYAADSGIERILYDERKGGGASDITKCSVNLDNGSSYGITLIINGGTTIKSWGCYDNVNRSIEAFY